MPNALREPQVKRFYSLPTWKNFLGLRIAILLSGFPSDLPVSLCAVQLATRTESTLYALEDSDLLGICHCDATLRDITTVSADTLLENFNFFRKLAAAAKIPVSYHKLKNGTNHPLSDFLIDHAISCLVVYADQKNFPVELIAWINKLQKRLDDSPNWFSGTLQIIVAPPWNEMGMEVNLAQL